ncbi:hypothetical protein AYO38_05615 [bacterium SCGC AG-212-C10]|nr:hypothetical protein AYO38_05615 [bacterium SCGC AG-212-C10]
MKKTPAPPPVHASLPPLGDQPDVRLVPVGELHPAAWNPRTITDERFQNLCRSIAADPEFLWRRPVLANLQGEVMAGNMRLRAAQHLGMDAIPAILDDVPEQLARERALRDNAQWGEWQEDDLAQLLAGLAANESDLSLLGFEDKALHKLLNSIDRGGGLTDPDDVPEAPAVPVTQPGDLWLLGEHRLLCGDSTDRHDVTIVMQGEKASMVFTDPPYGISYQDTGAGAWNPKKKALKVAGFLRPRFEPIAGDDLRGDELGDFLVAAFSTAAEACEPQAGWYVWHASRTQGIFEAALGEAGYIVRSQLIWAKSRPAFNFSQYKYKHEPCFYAFREGEAPSWYGDQSQTTVWDVASESGADYAHPTQKPVALATVAMKNSSRPGDIVLDSFLGSGSTLIAAELAGRRCFGLELDPKYCDVIVARWEDFSGSTAERVPSAEGTRS